MHIVLFPWLAFGHIRPFFELGRSFVARGHSVTFVSTPRNIAKLGDLAAPLASHINLVSLPLPPVDGLPATAECTADIGFDKMGLLKKAFDGLADPFAAFLAGASPKPDWIIFDFSHHWMPAIADAHGVPCCCFIPFNASLLVYIGPIEGESRKTVEDYLTPPPWVPFPSKLAYRRKNEAMWLSFAAYANTPSGISEHERYWKCISGCRVLSARSCPEFEGEYLGLLPGIVKRPVVPTGLILFSHDLVDAELTTKEERDMFAWLDAQPEKSVVFVALGTEVPLSREVTQGIALGLEQSGQRFLWALRTPPGTAAGDVLPDGFEARVGERGRVAAFWVPQIKILAHPAVGAFLTHCGWNSLIEALHFGHPLVMLPIYFDQGLNARVLEDKGVGVEIAREGDDGAFGAGAVADAVRKVMVEEEGKAIRAKAREMQDVFGDRKLQEKKMDEFVEYLAANRG